MQIPESWLRSLVDPPLSTEELTHLLTMSGLEVEHCVPVAPSFTGVVVAQILAVDRHPDADRLSVCRVDAGGETLQVVCGAPNVRSGMKAPLAKVGAKLTDDRGGAVEIKPAKVRGVESQGMLCSGRELGLSDDHSGIIELPQEASVGRDVREQLALADHVITIKLTPNRADCLSVLGVAREVAALTREKLAAPAFQPVPARNAVRHPVRITHPQGCGRFTGRAILNVNAGAPTPEWMRRRLERAGQRSISALVDVTNYVMLELGRPLHVYDLDKLRGPIDVRFGRAGERVTLLNEQTVEVDPSVLCITDESGVIGLAGIMGGDSTKAETTTRNLFLESAFFFPEAIAGRARRYNFASDASHRFERGVDFDNNVAGIERATQLILEICGGEPGPTDDLVARLPERKPVRMRVARAQRVIGVAIPPDEMGEVFDRLGLAYRRESRGREESFEVIPPSYRFDVEIEEDLIEEVARVYGFERIPARPPRAAAAMRPAREALRTLHEIRHRLAACDYHEVVNFSFVEPAWEADFTGQTNPIRLLNPIASQLSVMRTSLIGSLVENIRYNYSRKQPRIRVFEIGRVFLRDGGVKDGPVSVAGLRQPVLVAGAAYGAALEEQWGADDRVADFFDVKADVEALFSPECPEFVAAVHPAFHPGRCASIRIGDRSVGWIGELHPKWQHKYELPQSVIAFEVECEALQTAPVPKPEVPSKFPQVVRDMAVLVDQEVPAQALLGAIRLEKPAIVKDVRVFDLYHGQNLPRGRKSIAFRIVMQHTERTLTDAEADEARNSLEALLRHRFSADLRS